MWRYRKTLYVGFILLAFAAILSMFHYYHLDGLDGWVFSHLVADSTVYAEKYTDRAFRSIKRGMLFSDVIDLLGPPLEVRIEKDNSWLQIPYSDVSPIDNRVMCKWSESSNSSSYHMREIIFDNGMVDEKISLFDVD